MLKFENYQENSERIQPLLSVSDLAKILGLSSKSIYVKTSIHPDDLPPRFRIPGSRINRWHPEVVKKWMAERAGLISATDPTPTPKRPVGRPTKAAQIARHRGGHNDDQK